MSYIKIFFHVLKNSFSSVLYYKQVLKAPFSFSFKYFLFFSFLLSLIFSAVISVKILIPLNEFLARFPQILVKVYPADLEVKINKGVVTTNVQEPYFIPIERVEETFKEFEKNVQGARTDEIKNILVIDTNASIENLANYQTYALLTKSYLSYYKEDGRIETVSLEKVDNVTINQSIIHGIINKFLPFLKYLSLYLIPLVLVGSFMFLTISQLLYLLFSALVLYLVAKMVPYTLSYSKAYQVELHIATIIFPFFLLLGGLNIQLQFPFLRLIIFTVVGFYVLNRLKSANLSSSSSKK